MTDITDLQELAEWARENGTAYITMLERLNPEVVLELIRRIERAEDRTVEVGAERTQLDRALWELTEDLSRIQAVLDDEEMRSSVKVTAIQEILSGVRKDG